MIGMSSSVAAAAGAAAKTAAVPARKLRRSMDGVRPNVFSSLEGRMAWNVLAASCSVNAIGGPCLSDTESALRQTGLVNTESLRARTVQGTPLHFDKRPFQATHKPVHIEQCGCPAGVRQTLANA